MKNTSATERLGYGDLLAERLAGKAETISSVAASEGTSTQAVAKAVWLARAYDLAARAELGPALGALSASHLEVVAALERTVRTGLLVRAAAEGMSVRQLRAAARRRPHAAGAGAPVYTAGSTSDLASARRAMEAYMSWPDEGLRRLLEGPNGHLVKGLALAGRTLADRIEGG